MPKSKNSLSELLYDIRRIAENREKLSEKRIKAIYKRLSEDIDRFIADGYKKYADNEGRFYISYLDAHNKRAGFLQEIINNVDTFSPELKKEVQSLIDDTYSRSYQGMMSVFGKIDTREEFEKITKDIAANPDVLKRSVNNNISKLTLPAVMEKHRQEIIYQVQKELSIGLMQGERYEKMAKRISERINVSYGKAVNIARTESHRNVESGFMDCAERIQEGLENSGLIYAATWRTMKDKRVRPQQRRKTSKGWKTSISKNGADHQKMEGVTVKAGESFDLGGGVKAKAPGQSGVAAHDCNCRCFIEYNLMTEAEFAEAAGKKAKNNDVKPKSVVDNSGESGIIKIDDKQFGKKVGKHAQDFGLDASKSEDREKVKQFIFDIVSNNSEIRCGEWRGQSEDVLFYIKDFDVVIAKKTGEFITVMPGGVNNERVKNARKQ